MGQNEEPRQRLDRLTTRIAHGDGLAERELVSRCSLALHRMLMCLTHNRDLTDDLYQDTFVTMIRRFRQGIDLEDEALPHYARKTAQQLLANHRRKILRRGTRALSETDEAFDPRPSALTAVLRQEQRRIVLDALRKLAPRDRTLLYRVYFAEEERDAICIDLKLQTSHFKRVLFRARKRLRALILDMQSGKSRRR